jgi:hypothetical protein
VTLIRVSDAVATWVDAVPLSRSLDLAFGERETLIIDP